MQRTLYVWTKCFLHEEIHTKIEPITRSPTGQSLCCETMLAKKYPLFKNLVVRYHVHNSPSVDPSLFWMNPGYILISFIFRAHFDIILLPLSVVSCCVYLTDSLWCRQSQQSFNILIINTLIKIKIKRVNILKLCCDWRHHKESIILLAMPISSKLYLVFRFSNQNFYKYISHPQGYAVAWWLSHYTTNRKVAGSITMRWFLNLPNPSCCIRPWGLQSLNRNEYQKHKNNNVSGG
jgi:hypothetical protein